MDSNMNEVRPSPNPRKHANILSILFFTWMNPLLYKGFKKELDQDDLYETIVENKSDVLGQTLQTAWNEELNKKNYHHDREEEKKPFQPNFRNVLIRTFGCSLIPIGLICFFEECVIRLLQPWCMGKFMGYFTCKDDKISTLAACMYATGVVLTGALYCLIHHQFFFGAQIVGMRLRVAASSLIYRKALRLSKASVAKCGTGKIVNLLSNDVGRFDLSVMFIHYLWVGPLQFAVVIYLTWQRLGEVTLAGAAIILIFVPLQGWMSKQFCTLRGETAKKTDERISLMNEIINGIKVIKMYAWETLFARQIENARREEINVIRRTSYFRTINMSSYMIFVRLALAIILLVWVIKENIVTPEIAFLTLSWYNITKVSLVYFVPHAFTFAAEALKSISRIEEFLLLDEFCETRDAHAYEAIGNVPVEGKLERTKLNASNKSISAKHVFSKWNPDDDLDTIKDISFDVKEGECYGICGSVGDGKSAFLQTILGELPIHSGKMSIYGKLGYAAQDPWIFNGTVRQNILFGNEYNDQRYNSTIRLCNMQQDIASFQDGSSEIVGDRGTTLSGGQKVRLSLARAIYRDSDIYLLDDPLSAVDANVGKDLFERCIRGHLKDKVVVLVTHQLHFLKNVDRIIVLRQGEIVEVGTYHELMTKTSGRLKMLLEDNGTPSDTNSHNKSTSRHTSSISITPKAMSTTRRCSQNIALEFQSDFCNTASERQKVRDTCSLGSMQGLRDSFHEGDAPLAWKEDIVETDKHPEDSFHDIDNYDDDVDVQKALSDHFHDEEKVSIVVKQPTSTNIQHEKGSNMENSYIKKDSIDKKDSQKTEQKNKEESKVGSINMKFYWKYIHAGTSIFGVVILVISTLISHALFQFADAWLGVWTSNEILSQMSNRTFYMEENKEYDNSDSWVIWGNEKFNQINNYHLIVYCCSVAGIIVFCHVMILRFFAMCIGSSEKLHNQMFNRILTAPSRFFDDNPKGRILNRFSKDIGCMDNTLPTELTDLCQGMLTVFGIILVVFYKLWWMIFPTAIVILVFYFLRKYYLRSSAAIKRIEAAAKSPVFSQLASSVNGLLTIRCCGAQEKLIKEFDLLQDHHTSAWYCFIATTRFLGVYGDWIVFGYLSLCTFPFMLVDQEHVAGADVGLVISTALALTGMLQYRMRQSAELENLMTSVERVMEYSEIKTEEESEDISLITGKISGINENRNWPTYGIIEFNNVCLRYGNATEYVLVNVSFSIGKEEKVGIVGRTGAGKSSLITALYRLTEFEGEILIDGISTKAKKLNELRTIISIIPQDPVLFTGTLRMNLDPFNCYTDDEIWNVLGLANLNGYVLTLTKGLEHIITEGGENLSVGQRQLMCLARALLRKTKILILDEATANVDVETDEIIQKTIRKEFAKSTVLTIAHRLNTIIDYDKVLVLRRGMVEEFDSPNNLMNDKQSLFHSMCNDAGLVCGGVR